VERDFGDKFIVRIDYVDGGHAVTVDEIITTCNNEYVPVAVLYESISHHKLSAPYGLYFTIRRFNKLETLCVLYEGSSTLTSASFTYDQSIEGYQPKLCLYRKLVFAY
jgi:hypothetical protein